MIDDICPSCGHEMNNKNPGKPLCWFCYYRGSTGAVKLLVLNIFKNSARKLRPIDVVDSLNAMPMFKEKPTNETAVRRILYKYTKYRLISASKERRKHNGRPRKLYKITVQGKQALDKYMNNWLRGYPPILKTKSKKKFRMSLDYKERAESIAAKIANNEYDIYKFILPNRKTL